MGLAQVCPNQALLYRVLIDLEHSSAPEHDLALPQFAHGRPLGALIHNSSASLILSLCIG